MTTDTRVLTRPGPWSRVAGIGTIYGKTVRDSWRAALVIGGVASLFMIGTGAPYGFAPEFSTVALRQAFIDGLTALPPALRGLLGEPINLDTMGGFLSWRVGNFLPVMLGLWPVIALSGTIAGEAAKGSLDLLASTPQARRTIAIEKLAGHITAVILADAPAGRDDLDGRDGLREAAGRRDPGLGRAGPGDPVRRDDAVRRGRGVRDRSVGRADAGDGVRAHRAVRQLPHLQLRDAVAGHRRAQAAVVLHLDRGPPADGGRQRLAVGRRAGRGRRSCSSRSACVGFVRRDLGGVANVGWLRLPSLPAGIAGPFTRQLADRTGIALAWGLGIGLYGVLIVASADAFSDMITNLPQIAALIEAIYPGLDLTQPSAVLQLTFFSFGSFIIGLAGATFLAAWAADEGRRRLEVVLSHPTARAEWALRSGLGVLAAIGVVTLVIAIFIGVAVVTQGGDPVAPVAGIGILGLAAGAFAGVGLAVGGLVRSSLAAGVTGVLIIATLLIDTLGAALKLPQWVLDLSIYKHLGQPMAGIFDPVGIVVATVMVVGGLALCAVGFTRRDIGR